MEAGRGGNHGNQGDGLPRVSYGQDMSLSGRAGNRFPDRASQSTLPAVCHQCLLNAEPSPKPEGQGLGMYQPGPPLPPPGRQRICVCVCVCVCVRVVVGGGGMENKQHRLSLVPCPC